VYYRASVHYPFFSVNMTFLFAASTHFRDKT
jgi:hypothetical protein